MVKFKDCPYALQALREITEGKKKKINTIWLEISGCFGEIISLLNGEDPSILYFLDELVNMVYLGSITGDEGERAYERILDTLNTEYIFCVCGAVPLKDDGLFTTVATYKGRKITAMEAVTTIAAKAKAVIAVGTCASFGGPTSASPNVSQAVSISEFLKRKDIINISGCPANPAWTIPIIAYIVSNGSIPIDELGRPLAYYGETVHANCSRRRFFDKGVFAKKLGDKECMFKLGCRGPITYAYCPVSRWNNTDNWPVGDNTPCIGCAAESFPDGMEPFTTYGGE